jgi:hypothetical protein
VVIDLILIWSPWHTYHHGKVIIAPQAVTKCYWTLLHDALLGKLESDISKFLQKAMKSSSKLMYFPCNFSSWFTQDINSSKPLTQQVDCPKVPAKWSALPDFQIQYTTSKMKPAKEQGTSFCYELGWVLTTKVQKRTVKGWVVLALQRQWSPLHNAQSNDKGLSRLTMRSARS